MKVLVTGTAGFIGSHVAMHLLERGDEVIGIDNLSDYYDVELKKARLARFADRPGYRHEPVDLADRAAIEAVFARHRPQRVINLAAQAGVRYAAQNPPASPLTGGDRSPRLSAADSRLHGRRAVSRLTNRDPQPSRSPAPTGALGVRGPRVRRART